MGFPRKHFRVRFRARNDARGSWFYDVEATGPEREGCDSDTAVFVHADRGDLKRVVIPTGKANWCIGRYEGLIFLFREDADGEFVSEKVVGRFSFRVEAEE